MDFGSAQASSNVGANQENIQKPPFYGFGPHFWSWDGDLDFYT